MLSDWFLKVEPVKPYSQLANIYDYVMRHVDYRHWARYLVELFRKAEVDVREILDISCGTGSLLLEMANFNFKLAGFDASDDMLKLAKLKLQKAGLSIPVWVGCMQHFQVRKRFHGVVCTYDSFNYCLHEDDWHSVFGNVFDALVPGGIFVFDVSTIRNSRKYFRNYHEKETTSAFEYERESYYLMPESEQINEFSIRWNSGQNKIFREIHRQRIYKIAEIQERIPANWFEMVAIYDGFSFRKGTERSDRVHFLLKRI